MATLATCSSSLAIRRSWRMTRSLSDLNSRSTSSSLSSIFWSKSGKNVSSTNFFMRLPNTLWTIVSYLLQHQFPWQNEQGFYSQWSPAAVNIFPSCSTELWPTYQSMCWSITFLNCSSHNGWDKWGSQQKMLRGRKCREETVIIIGFKTLVIIRKAKKGTHWEIWHVYTFTLTTEGCGEACFWTVGVFSAFVAGLVSRTFVLTTFRSRFFVET